MIIKCICLWAASSLCVHLSDFQLEKDSSIFATISGWHYVSVDRFVSWQQNKTIKVLPVYAVERIKNKDAAQKHLRQLIWSRTPCSIVQRSPPVDRIIKWTALLIPCCIHVRFSPDALNIHTIYLTFVLVSTVVLCRYRVYRLLIVFFFQAVWTANFRSARWWAVCFARAWDRFVCGAHLRRTKSRTESILVFGQLEIFQHFVKCICLEIYLFACAVLYRVSLCHYFCWCFFRLLPD